MIVEVAIVSFAVCACFAMRLYALERSDTTVKRLSDALDGAQEGRAAVNEALGLVSALSERVDRVEHSVTKIGNRQAGLRV